MMISMANGILLYYSNHLQNHIPLLMLVNTIIPCNNMDHKSGASATEWLESLDSKSHGIYCWMCQIISFDGAYPVGG